jgi:hypothetical protein
MSLKKRLILCFACALPLLVAGGLLWLDAAGKQAVADAQARIRAAGLPLTIDEIRPPRVPDADNAALVIGKLKPLLDTLDFGSLSELVQMEKSFPIYRLDADDTKFFAEKLENQPVRQVIALVREAAGKKGYNVKVEYEQGRDERQALTADTLLFTSFLLSWHARLAASRGQDDEACDDVWSMIVLAEFYEESPTVYSQTSFGFLGSALKVMEKLVAAGAVSVEWNQRFAARLANLDRTRAMARIVDEERIVYGEYACGQILEGKMTVDKLLGEFRGRASASDWNEWLRRLRYRIPGVVRLEYADYIDQMCEVHGIMAQDSLSFDVMEKKMEATLRSVPKEKFLMGAVGVPELDSWGASKPLSTQIQRAAIVSAETGLALERYRTAKGGYPATLGALVPEFLRELPMDILARKPLIYRPEPGGAVVYSVGPNMKDDGGIEDIDSNKDDQGWFAGAAALRKFAPPPAPASP